MIGGVVEILGDSRSDDDLISIDPFCCGHIFHRHIIKQSHHGELQGLSSSRADSTSRAPPKHEVAGVTTQQQLCLPSGRSLYPTLK